MKYEIRKDTKYYLQTDVSNNEFLYTFEKNVVTFIEPVQKIKVEQPQEEDSKSSDDYMEFEPENQQKFMVKEDQ